MRPKLLTKLCVDRGYHFKHGIAPLCLSAIPALLGHAKDMGYIDGCDVVVASGDDGATSMGRLVQYLLKCSDMIVGAKVKLDGTTAVSYSPDALRVVAGKTVIFAEDIISTGKTMASAIMELLIRGKAEKVVVLATYPIFANNALMLLGHDHGIKIVTTDGKTPLTSVDQSSNISVIPITDRQEKVAALDKAGVDFWSPTGAEELAKIGLCRAPWQLNIKI